MRGRVTAFLEERCQSASEPFESIGLAVVRNVYGEH
jgi:hypothetical protein